MRHDRILTIARPALEPNKQLSWVILSVYHGHVVTYKGNRRIHTSLHTECLSDYTDIWDHFSSTVTNGVMLTP